MIYRVVEDRRGAISLSTLCPFLLLRLFLPTKDLFKTRIKRLKSFIIPAGP